MQEHQEQPAPLTTTDQEVLVMIGAAQGNAEYFNQIIVAYQNQKLQISKLNEKNEAATNLIAGLKTEVEKATALAEDANNHVNELNIRLKREANDAKELLGQLTTVQDMNDKQESCIQGLHIDKRKLNTSISVANQKVTNGEHACNELRDSLQKAVDLNNKQAGQLKSARSSLASFENGTQHKELLRLRELTTNQVVDAKELKSTIKTLEADLMEANCTITVLKS